MRSPNPRVVARHLAIAALADPWNAVALARRFVASFRPAPHWLADLARALVDRYDAAQAAALDVDTLTDRLHRDALVRDGIARGEIPAPRTAVVDVGPPSLDVPGLPVITTDAELADRLELDAGELVWLADEWSQEARRAEGPLRHYRYRWLARDYGPDRLIEMPKPRLRDAQRFIHQALLRHVPVHAAAQGFVRGRGAIGHARLHTGTAWVVRLDLSQFFCRITRSRVRGVFALLGYDARVAALLAALCTNRVPTQVIEAAPHGAPSWEQRQLLRMPHLPQGAPTSPALANLVAYALDVRLAALATTFGATYSRYADDLTFSHPRWSRAAASRCARTAAVVAAECGFTINPRKTLMMGAQHAQTVTGVVVNRHANLARRDYDRLKAILTNCVRHGPASQNRDGRADFRAWLRGHLAHAQAINPARAGKLVALYARIDWN
jgi:hypothetical protein